MSRAAVLQQFVLPHGPVPEAKPSDRTFCAQILENFDSSDSFLEGLKDDLTNFVVDFGHQVGEETLLGKLRGLSKGRRVFLAARRDGAVCIKREDAETCSISVFNKLPTERDFLFAVDGVAVTVPHYTGTTTRERLLQPFPVKQLSELTAVARRTSGSSVTKLLTHEFVPTLLTKKHDTQKPIQKVLKNKLEVNQGDKGELLRGPLAMHFDIFLHTTLVEALGSAKGEAVYHRILLASHAEALDEWMDVEDDTKNSSLCDRSIARLAEQQVALTVLLSDSGLPSQSSFSRVFERVTEVIKKGRRKMEEGWKTAQAAQAQKSAMTMTHELTPEAIQAAAVHDFGDALKYAEYARGELESAGREKAAVGGGGRKQRMMREEVEYGPLPSITNTVLLSDVLRVLEGGEKPVPKKGKGAKAASHSSCPEGVGEDRWALESRVAEVERFVLEILWRLPDATLGDERHFGVENLKKLSEMLTELFHKTRAEEDGDVRALSRFLLCRLALLALMDRALCIDPNFREFTLPIPSFMTEHLHLSLKEEKVLAAEIEEHVVNRARGARKGKHVISILSDPDFAAEKEASSFHEHFVAHVGDLAQLKRV
eukprot:Cvel_5357.t1-p1 / transcript=Cvel_5357.t1 / gene=Cvel_5357 / organism=Chromera_velia_CCMP2878 / gene_product=hypothetical protein / transcript_product=hypothetical protein / location=Cvel_scaffold249:808-4327(-) / protein_length=597 / sequence_SO=supercontig / SO=protein_coding / is_pseudo=false